MLFNAMANTIFIITITNTIIMTNGHLATITSIVADQTFTDILIDLIETKDNKNHLDRN